MLLLALAPAAPASADPRPPLGHEGRWITDADGRVVVVRGFNMVNKLPPYHPRAVGFGEDDARFLREEGFNTIRLGVTYAGLEPRPGQIDEGYVAELLSTAKMLGRHGIFTLFDFHQDQYAHRFNGNGFPDWAIMDDGLPPEPDVGFPGNYVAMPALERAFDHLWANDAPPATPGRGLQDSLAEAWRRAALRFRALDTNLGYNLLNEPWPGSQYPSCMNTRGCPAFDQLYLTPFSKRLIAGVRRADRQALVWYAPLLTFDFGSETHHGDTGDSRSGFAFNVYCLAASPINQGGGDSSTACGIQEQRPMDLAAERSRTTGDALLMTEWGAVDDERTLARVADLADRAMLPWQHWAYFNRDFSRPRPEHNLVADPAAPPVGRNVKAAKLAILSRPYPRVVAGTPESWRFDRAQRRFDLRYSTRRPGGGAYAACDETEVFVPPRHFGSRYGLDVEGAYVVSRPAASVLRLVAKERAGHVRVRVERDGGFPERSRHCQPRIRLRMSPREPRAGRRVRLRFRATAVIDGRRRAVARARVRVGSVRRRTNRRGYVRFRPRLRRGGTYRAMVAKDGFRGTNFRFRALRPPRR